jgi:hypothetical protein
VQTDYVAGAGPLAQPLLNTLRLYALGGTGIMLPVNLYIINEILVQTQRFRTLAFAALHMNGSAV